MLLLCDESVAGGVGKVGKPMLGVNVESQVIRLLSSESIAGGVGKVGKPMLGVIVESQVKSSKLLFSMNSSSSLI